MSLKKTIIQTNFYITSWVILPLNRFSIKYIKKLYPQHVSQFFICLKRPGIFVQRIHQLKNFDMNLKGYYLGCLLL